jgi:hypothetical protein
MGILSEQTHLSLSSLYMRNCCAISSAGCRRCWRQYCAARYSWAIRRLHMHLFLATQVHKHWEGGGVSRVLPLHWTCITIGSIYVFAVLCWTVVAFLVSQFISSRWGSLDGDQPVARPLPTYRATQTKNKSTLTSIPRVRFEPTIPVFERTKTVHTLRQKLNKLRKSTKC